MAFLRRRSAFEQLENEIAGLRSRRDVLADRLARADADIERALADRRRQLVETDLDQGDVEPTHIGQLREARASFADAVAAIDLKIAEAVARLDQERDRLQRKTAATELSGVTDELAKLADDLAAVTSKIPSKLGAVIDRLPHAVVSKSHTAAFADEVVAALRLVVSEARSHASQVTAGTGSIYEPAQQPANPPVPKVERLEIFPLQPSKWTEPDGTVLTVGAHVTCDPPVEVARAALANGNAIDPLCDNAITLRTRVPPCYAHYAAEDCIDITQPKSAKPPRGLTAAAPAVHSEFVGRPRIGTATVRNSL
jgi:hypothetical protein